MIEACIFDLDGVIVDTAKYHYLAWKRLAEYLSIPFTAQDNEKMKGISRRASLERLLELGEKKYDAHEKDKFYLTKNIWYLESIKGMNESDILPGVPQFLEVLKAQNIRIALGSASKNARPVLDLIGLTEKFEVIVDGNDVVNSKPDPEVFLKGAKLLNKPPKKVVVFEDSAKGIDAAKAGGFKTVGLGLEEHLGHADVVFGSFNEFSLEDLNSVLFP